MTVTIFESEWGDSLYPVAKQMVYLANQTYSVVESSFNEFTLRARPFQNPVEVAKPYRAHVQRESVAYWNSPKWIAAAKAYEERRIAQLNAEPKEFPVEVVLSVTTGRLLTKHGNDDVRNGIYAIYEFVGHCLAGDCFDIVFPAMGNLLKPRLIERFPELDISTKNIRDLDDWINLSKFIDPSGEGEITARAIAAWVSSLGLPSSYVIPVMVS